MSEVLGSFSADSAALYIANRSFSADSAALYIANRNCKPNELSLAFRKDGFSICFLNSFLGLKFVSKAGL